MAQGIKLYISIKRISSMAMEDSFVIIGVIYVVY